MKKSTIYTKTGDEGMTGLVSGARVSKADMRIDVYGDLDELNSRVGLLCAHLESTRPEIVSLLHRVQCTIFNLGSNMACEYENREKFNLPYIDHSIINELESSMDEMDRELPPLKNFILPGGSILASHAHLARTCTRSIERKMIKYTFATGEDLPERSIVFLNRLSDYFFLLARFINVKAGIKETIWTSKS